MGLITCLASFPNSRIAPRPSTQIADTYTVNIPNGVNTLLVPANVNRTYLNIKNDSLTTYVRYDYEDTGATLATDGFLLAPGAAVDIEAPLDVWVRALGANVDISIDEGEG
jgi:hypothetical protein